MVFQTRPRSILLVPGLSLVASTFACGGSDRRTNTRLGDDLVMSGSAVYLSQNDTVPGDAILTGRDVQFHGAIGGDYLGAGGMQTVAGRIHGSVRAAGGQIHVAGAIDRNATIAGGRVTLDSTADIGRNAYLVGGNVEVDGTVRGALLVSGCTVVLNGTVGKDVEVRGDAFRVGPHAVITGNLRYRVPAGKVHIDSGAHISGKVTALPVSRGWGVHWLLMLGFLVAGIFVVSLLPRFTIEAAAIIPERPIRAALVGLGWFILVPLAVIIAAITVIGIPLAVITVLLYGVAVYLSSVPFSVWLGWRAVCARARAGGSGGGLNSFVGG